MTPGVLLVNLGSPDSPSVPDVRRYLCEFLMDGLVLDAPWPVRFFVVNAMILPFRPKQSAEAYHKIWTPEGSPLVFTSRKVCGELQRRIPFPVEVAMRYQNPTIVSAIDNLKAKGVDSLLLIPLFPHYAMSSFETAVERVKEVAASRAPQMTVQVQEPYFGNADYIAALVDSAKPYLNQEFDLLLFSFHGIPERHLRQSDPTHAHCMKSSTCCEMASPAHATCYRHQCFATVNAFVQMTKLPADKYAISFQSRLGREPWLRPYTDFEVERFAKNGIKRLLVICPSFVSDCLETLEEIGIRARESFMAAGGKGFDLIPCLNENSVWLTALQNMVRRAFDRSE